MIMTARELKICKAILQVLHDLDGGQLVEVALHGETNVKCECGLAEFTAALKLCDTKGWLTGVPGKFSGRKYNINDAGEAALLEMR